MMFWLGFYAGLGAACLLALIVMAAVAHVYGDRDEEADLGTDPAPEIVR